MPVSYIGAIRNVLDIYPPSKGLFREILQNSEDAKARKQIFVLDHRTSGNVVVGHEKPVITQGPALLAYNDSTFTEKDFKSLFNLWDSSKKADATKIGKFGMGFRSTFHLSDTPQVLSQSTLAILDPLNKSEQTDLRIELNSDEKRVEILEPFALHLFQPDITSGTVFQGTVVRLPFREVPSEISPKVFSPAEISQLFVDFVQEEIQIALLFLTNLASIEFFEIDLNGEVECIAKSSISRSQQIILEDVLIHSCVASFVDLTETTEIIGRVLQPSQKWRILRTSFSPHLASSELSKRLGFDAVDRLKEHKLHPVLSIATKLSIFEKADAVIGRLFTFLPLPLFTQFCVHVHGLFSLTPSREKLQNREEKPAHNTDYHISVEWNKLLFEEYLPQAWMCLLYLLTKSGIKNVFDAWPPPQKANQLGDSGYWEKLPDNLVENLIKSKCSVWPIFRSSGEFHDLENVLVAGDGESAKLLDVLAVSGLKITRPPGFIIDILKRYPGVSFLTPAVAHSSLLGLKDNLVSHALKDKLPIILKYLLSTGKMEYIIDLPVIPTLNGPVALTRRSSSSITHVLLERSEFNLFEACDNNAIALGHIDTYVADLLKRHGPSILNVELLSPDVVIRYLQNYARLMPAFGMTMVTLEHTTLIWISNFWLWMKEWDCSHQLYPLLGQLFLLPTQEGLRPTYSPVFQSTGIHPLLLSPLKQLHVPFLHQTFGHGSAARSALSTFRSFSDVSNLEDILDALDLDTVKSFIGNEETSRQLAKYISQCAPKNLNGDQRQKLRSLPIFPSHPMSPIQGRIRIPEDWTAYGVTLTNFPLLPDISETIMLDGLEMSIALLRAAEPNARGFLSDVDVLRLGLTQFTRQSDTTQQAIVEFMASNRRKIPGELIEVLGKTSFVTVADGSRCPPYKIVDPRSPLRALYEVSCFLPHRDIEESRLIYNLRTLCLMQTVLSTDMLKEHIHHITSKQDHDSARKLVRVIYETRFKLPEIQEIYEEWLPTPKGLRSPRACRDDPHRRNLFDRVLPPLDHNLRTDHFFRASFGWDQPVPLRVLSQQLLLTLDARSNVYNAVYDIVKELMERTLSDKEIVHLKNVVGDYSWVPVSGTQHRLARSENAVFSDEDPSVGFYQIMFPGRKSINFFTRMGCSERPSTTAILNRLSDLRGEHPSLQIARKAHRLLSLLNDDISDDDRSRVLVPDSNCSLRLLRSVLFNDIGERAVLVSLSNDQYMAHNMIDDSLAMSLGMDRLGLKFVDLKPLGIDMGEKLTTTIANKLRSYTPRQILTEFIANASDAGATEFGIITDETIMFSNKILSRPLARMSESPSLVLYNNAVFSAEDFDGICQTGIGGKSDRRDSIGQFGFGALTMFHLTDFAIIVSGDSVLFLEPSKQFLPIKDRATLKLPLQHVKKMYPDHLEPLDGLFGFEIASTKNYQGTLFRLPLRKHVEEFSLGEAWDIHRLRDLIEPFGDHAEEFLLFTSICTITISHRPPVGKVVCRRRIASDLREEKTIDKFRTNLFDVSILSGDAHHSTETQSWHIVSTSSPGQQEISESLTKYRLRSPVTLAIAARTDTGIKTKQGKKLVYKFFSSLPLISSCLPVHITAPFILSDDRRQIRLDNLDPAVSDYNQWLLSAAIPPLYLFLLSDLLSYNHDNGPWWPGDTQEEDELTRFVISSFYDKFLKASTLRVFFPMYKAAKSPGLTSQEAVLGGPRRKNAIDEVFRLLETPLALLPFKIVRRAHAAGLAQMTPVYLSSIIRQSSINLAGCLQSEDLNELLIFLGVDNLRGLRLLPLSSGEFGVIERAGSASYKYFIASESVHALFPRSQHLVDAKFKPTETVLSLFDSDQLIFNVTRFGGPGLKLLMASKLREGNTANHDMTLQAWITSFWSHYHNIKVDLQYISTFPLVPTARPGFYTSINNCKDHAAVILSTLNTEEAWLWPILSNLGLTIVERHSKSFPRYLSRTVLSGTEFPISFADVLSAMAASQHTVISQFADLDVNDRKLLVDWCRRKLESGSLIPTGHLLAFARKLPIWPVTQLDGSLLYYAADSVIMLPEGLPAELARRFMNLSSTPYSIGFLRLKKDTLTFSKFFESLNLPQVLSRNDVLPYKTLLVMFLRNSQSIPSLETLRVPDTNLILRHPRDLYAHDSLFLSAFEGSHAFILDEFLDMEPQFFRFGMKREVDLDINMFTSCARALHDASSVSNINPERARIVFEAYCEVLPLRISSRQRHLWSTLDHIRFIPCDPSRRRASVPTGLDPTAYVRLLPAIVSPNELMLPEYESIAWTQRAHFLHQPGERIHIVNPSLGCPSFSDVVEHLRILAIRVLQDFPSSPRLLEELTKTYVWLNDNCGDRNNAGLLATLHAEPLFLNVVDSSDFATWEWHTADQLLLNETEAVSRFHLVKPFLLQFEKLLRATGVKAVVHHLPPSEASSSSDSDQLNSIRQAFQKMRQAGLLTDVVFIAADDYDDEEEEILPCHRAFLATYSSFFCDAFTNEIEEANLTASVLDPKIMEITEYSTRCVSCALDFAYTGIIDDSCPRDLDLMLEILAISNFWLMDRLHDDIQRLIVSRKLITIETCQQIEEVAQTYRATFLLQQCQEYRKYNKHLM